MTNLGSNFYPKLVQMTSELGMKPEDLLAIMVSESGIRPDAGKSGSAAGLIQFISGTLPGTGFKGNTDDFRQLSGEAQLPYIKRYIEGVMQKNGGPFTSAAKYYVANFIPEALKLPGIRRNDPSCRFVEENPETVTDPHSGRVYSKKYYEIGDRITPQEERGWYKDNPLFHGSVPGAITYGDMIKQVEKNKRNPIYQKALMAMNQSTGYQPNLDSATPGAPQPEEDKGIAFLKQLHQRNNPSPIASNNTPPSSSPGLLNDVMDYIDKFMKQVMASERNNKKLYKHFLPSHKIVIKIAAPQYTDAVEFSRVLCTALDEELMSKAFIHTDEKNVEIECSIRGPQKECFETVRQLTNSLAEVFTDATIKIGGIKVRPEVIMNKKSSYQKISLESAVSQHRKFLLKFI